MNYNKSILQVFIFLLSGLAVLVPQTTFAYFGRIIYKLGYAIDLITISAACFFLMAFVIWNAVYIHLFCLHKKDRNIWLTIKRHAAWFSLLSLILIIISGVQYYLYEAPWRHIISVFVIFSLFALVIIYTHRKTSNFKKNTRAMLVYMPIKAIGITMSSLLPLLTINLALMISLFIFKNDLIINNDILKILGVITLIYALLPFLILKKMSANSPSPRYRDIFYILLIAALFFSTPLISGEAFSDHFTVDYKAENERALFVTDRLLFLKT